eukprot:6223349-Amphidinium_carterae.1
MASCKACGRMGHWASDASCPQTQAGQMPPATQMSISSFADHELAGTCHCAVYTGHACSQQGPVPSGGPCPCAVYSQTLVMNTSDKYVVADTSDEFVVAVVADTGDEYVVAATSDQYVVAVNSDAYMYVHWLWNV